MPAARLWARTAATAGMCVSAALLLLLYNAAVPEISVMRSTTVTSPAGRRRQRQLAAAAACESGYTLAAGQISGWGTVGTHGNREGVSTCAICAGYCTADTRCLSYECSPTALLCELNTIRHPKTPISLLDYAFCQKYDATAGSSALYHTPDTRPGCPATRGLVADEQPSSGPFATTAGYSRYRLLDTAFQGKGTMVVMIQGRMARRHAGATLLGLTVGHAEVDFAVTWTGSNEWKDSAVGWVGAVNFSSSNTRVGTTKATLWGSHPESFGCGEGHGHLDVLVLPNGTRFQSLPTGRNSPAQMVFDVHDEVEEAMGGAPVLVQGHVVHTHKGTSLLQLKIDGVVQATGVSATSQWAADDARVSWSGYLPRGTHVLELSTPARSDPPVAFYADPAAPRAHTPPNLDEDPVFWETAAGHGSLSVVVLPRGTRLHRAGGAGNCGSNATAQQRKNGSIATVFSVDSQADLSSGGGGISGSAVIVHGMIGRYATGSSVAELHVDGNRKDAAQTFTKKTTIDTTAPLFFARYLPPKTAPVLASNTGFVMQVANNYSKVDESVVFARLLFPIPRSPSPNDHD